MIRQPKPGQRVRIHYSTRAKRKGMAIPAEFMPWHGKTGTIVSANIRTKGPCNVAVKTDDEEFIVGEAWWIVPGELVVVPRGNLVAVEGA